jgi:cell division protein YceG involved in septum cleavage
VKSRALGLALLLGTAACAGSNTQDERVTLPPGATFGAVTDTLAAHGVIANRRLFRLIARAPLPGRCSTCLPRARR